MPMTPDGERNGFFEEIFTTKDLSLRRPELFSKKLDQAVQHNNQTGLSFLTTFCYYKRLDVTHINKFPK